jgi:N-methylhydantoinase B
MDNKALVEILNHRFLSIVEEMGFTIQRTGHTIFIKETGDFGTALVTPAGEVFAAPLRVGMIRTIGMPFDGAIAAMEVCNDNDVWVANDPIATRGMSTHLPDIYLWKPIVIDGILICYAWCFMHVSDIGGRVPGSIAPLSSDIYQEGLRIPPCRLYKDGVLDRELASLILANSRIPDQNWGDLQAGVLALRRGDQRIRELVQRYGMEVVQGMVEEVLNYAERRARQLIDALPDGEYEFSDYLEGGSTLGYPLRVHAKVRVQGSAIELDFTETCPQVPTAFNIPTAGQPRHNYLVVAIVNYLRTLDREMPFNSGLVRSVSCRTRPGSLLNPEPGAAVGVRAVTMHRVSDVVMGCLSQACPEIIPAAGSGGGAIVLLSAETDSGRKVSVVEPLTGGSGGRPELDGINGCDIVGGAIRNIPVEVLEQELPILVHRYGLRKSSGGAGRRRGGLGTEFAFELLAPAATVTARGMERRRFRPWGVRGGKPGSPATLTHVSAGGGTLDHPQLDVVKMLRGDILTFAAAGGAGFGDPLERDASSVWLDVVNEYIAPEDAALEYGVVLGADGQIDEHRTRRLRARLSAKRRTLPQSMYDFGPEREDFERTWPERLLSGLALGLSVAPGHLRHLLYEQALDLWRGYFERAEDIRCEDLVHQVLTNNCIRSMRGEVQA